MTFEPQFIYILTGFLLTFTIECCGRMKVKSGTFTFPKDGIFSRVEALLPVLYLLITALPIIFACAITYSAGWSVGLMVMGSSAFGILFASGLSENIAKWVAALAIPSLAAIIYIWLTSVL